MANFSGLPSCSLPIGLVNSLPVSININSAYGKDKEVLGLASELEKELKDCSKYLRSQQLLS